MRAVLAPALVLLLVSAQLYPATAEQVAEFECPEGNLVTDVPPNSDLFTIIAPGALGRTYRLAAGTYNISRPIRIASPADLNATVCIVGTSPQEVFVTVSTINRYGFNITSQPLLKLGLKGLTIDGQADSRCIRVEDTQFAMQNVVVRNCRRGPALSMVQMNTGSSLVSVAFSDNRDQPFSSVDINQGSPTTNHKWREVSQ